MSNSKLTMTKTMLEEPKNLAGIFDLKPFKDRFERAYNSAPNATGDGDMAWEREKTAFLHKVFSDPKIAKCTRMSVYDAFLQLAISGLSLTDDQAYLVAYKDTLTFQPGWKGKLEILSTLDKIADIGEPMVVYASDDFDYTLFPRPGILKHKRELKRPENDPITHVYICYDLEGSRSPVSGEQLEPAGQRCFIMEISEVIRIRNKYSKPYIYYMAKKGVYDNGNKMDLPFALEFPDKYAKKTCVHQLYKATPKNKRMMAIESKVEVDAEDMLAEDIDHEVMEDAIASIEKTAPKEIETTKEAPSDAGKEF